MNDVKEAGTKSGEGLTHDRCPTEQQGGPDRHRTNAKGGKRRRSSQKVNRIVMEGYYSRNLEVVGHIERMHVI